jgi:NAD(P)-dependent dehydrogenase (short-subunit alcohol dehydrogenase family)
MKIAIVTGPTRGIGREISLGMAQRGFHVVAAGRSEKRLAQLVAEIDDLGGSGEMLGLDLASLASTRDAARAFAASGRTTDVLVNNAGIGPTSRGLTVEGFEAHFGVNHLGHFSFTHHLGPTFREGTRIVQVVSALHNVEGIDFGRLTRRTWGTGVSEYAVSKLANILFVRELARRRPRLRAYAAHPGFADTGIIPWFVKPFVSRRLISAEEGAATPLWCATDAGLAGESGRYYARMERRDPRPVAQDDLLASELWERSEIWCGISPRHG